MARNNYGEDVFEHANRSDPLFRVKQIGTTHAIENVNAIEAIKADIFRGAGNIEIQANGMGASRGQGMSNITFEGIDPEQRRAIRELARINEVNITTHATYQAGNLSGLGREGFNDAQRARMLDEIKKAIDFSSEAANGGSVVVHTNEFPRPLGISKDEGGFLGGKFEFAEHSNSEKDSIITLVDKQSGQLSQIKRDTVIFRPKYRKDESGNRDYLKDEHGNPLYEEVFKDAKVQKAREDNPTLRNVSDDEIWESLPESDKDFAKIYLYESQNGNIQVESVTYDTFAEEQKKRGMTDYKQIQKEFVKEQLLPQAQASLGQSRVYEARYHGGLMNIEKIAKDIETLTELKETLSDDQYRAIALNTLKDYSGGRTDVLEKMDTDQFLNILKNKQNEEKNEILMGGESGASGRSRAREVIRRIENLDSLENYALNKSRQSMAELGLYAIERTNRMTELRPGDKVKPITITLENIFPEGGYGSHPEELRKLVDEGRDELKKALLQQGHDSSEAKKLSDQTIKITLDTGHLNMWRKYFKRQDGETKEDTDKRFKQWYTEQVDELAKNGYIGNMHIADNLGWDDSHLAAGQGNAPVREVMEILRRHGYDDVVTSEGGFGRGPGGEFGLQQTWKLAGAHFTNYNGNQLGDDAWTNPGSTRLYSVMEGYGGSAPGAGYFSDIQKPNFIFKGYAPDSEDWRPWSGTGME